MVYIETFRCHLDPVAGGRPLLDVLKDIREFNISIETYDTNLRRGTIGVTLYITIENWAHRPTMASMRRGLQPTAPTPEPANPPEADDSDAETGSGPDKNSEPPASSPEGSDGEQDEQHLASGNPAPGPTLLIETPKNGFTEGEVGSSCFCSYRCHQYRSPRNVPGSQCSRRHPHHHHHHINPHCAERRG